MLYAMLTRGSAWLATDRPLYMSPRIPRLKLQLRRVMLSCTYIASSLTSVWPTNGNRTPPRARSYGSRVLLNRGYRAELVAFGLEAMLGWYPAPAHCEGSVKPLTGTAFTSRQGALRVGSTIPSWSFSFRKVCSYMMPAFTL